MRLRAELFETPAARADRDRDYSLIHARFRLGGQAVWAPTAGGDGLRWTLRGELQGAASDGVPALAAFAAGPAYAGANPGEDRPTMFGVSEATVAVGRGGFSVTAGRRRSVDAGESAASDKGVEALRNAKLSERLIGNWEWTNVGRRFDGLWLSWKARSDQHLAVFVARPLGGGIDYDDAFEALDVTLAGGSWSSLAGSWLERGEVRLFALTYDDTRQGARTAVGGDLELLTVGGSWLAAGSRHTVLTWGALQTGDWGQRRQRAWAAIVGGQLRFPNRRGAPSLYLGLEAASGDAPGGDHGGFFNLLPTNHKFYGSLDYNAFSNLVDGYLEARWAPIPKLQLVAAIHGYALLERGDAWWGGSGAFDDLAFGYQARRPAGGVPFPSRDLGRELDLEGGLSLPRGFELRGGGGWFWGGDAAMAVLPVADDGGWLFVELGWKR